MKKHSLIICCTFLMFSCKKNKSDSVPSVPEPENPVVAKPVMLPLKAGNYWIYQFGMDDSTGTHLQANFDSVYVEKDTVIAGQNYYKVCHTNFYFQHYYYYMFLNSDTPVYLRDSLDYLVAPGGNILLDRTNLHDTIRRFIYSADDYACIVPNAFTQKQFVTGVYSGNSMDQIYYRNIPGYNVVGDTVCSAYFVKDIGIVKTYYSFSACLNNCRYSHNLIRYHLN